jgi:hypothetical protein
MYLPWQGAMKLDQENSRRRWRLSLADIDCTRLWFSGLVLGT